MGIAVREHVTVPARPWHSVVIDVDIPISNSWRLPYQHDPEIQHLVNIKNHLRSILHKIAGAFEISQRRTRVMRNRQGYSGYVFVYQGDGTEEEREKLVLAMMSARKYASRLRSLITRQEKRT